MRPNDFIHACQTCGVPVMDRKKHEVWHKDLEETMRTTALKEIRAVLDRL